MNPCHTPLVRNSWPLAEFFKSPCFLSCVENNKQTCIGRVNFQREQFHTSPYTTKQRHPFPFTWNSDGFTRQRLSNTRITVWTTLASRPLELWTPHWASLELSAWYGLVLIARLHRLGLVSKTMVVLSSERANFLVLQNIPKCGNLKQSNN